MPTITRERAIAISAGKKRYVSSKTCRNGHHGAERYSINGSCIECKKLGRLRRKPEISREERSQIAKTSHLERLKEKSRLWADGVLDESKLTNRVIRRMLSDLNGYSCSCCGISNWNGSALVLEVEHVDGNSQNNSYHNVCLICPNCHSQTPTYKGANKGNGRYYRRMRYAEEKSY